MATRRRTSVRRRRTYRRKFKPDIPNMIVGGALAFLGMILIVRYKNKQLQPNK